MTRPWRTLWIVGLGLGACEDPAIEPLDDAVDGDTSVPGSADGSGHEDDDEDDGPADEEADGGDTGDGPDPDTGDEGTNPDAGDEGTTDDDPTPHPPPAPHGCVTAVQPGAHTLHCGIPIEMVVPPQCIHEACGIVLDVHGATMDADQQNLNTGLRALGVEHGYIVLQPSSPGGQHAPANDAALVGAVTDTLMAFHADPTRLHVTGFSAGGNVTWRMVCNHSDLFASAAPAAAADDSLIPSGCNFSAGQTPAHELPILYMHGRHDGLEAFAGAEKQRDHVVSGWAMSGPELVDMGDGFVRERYQSAAGTSFEFLVHDYTTDQVAFTFALEGHCFPGSTDHAPTLPGQLAGYGCKGDNAFHFGQVVMQFFIDHPK